MLTPAALGWPSPPSARRGRTAVPAGRARCVSTTSTPATATEERFARRVVARRGRVARHPRRPVDDTNLGKYLFEVRDRATNRVALLARLREHLRRVGDDGRGQRPSAARSTSRCASRSRRRPVQVDPEEARRGRRLPRGLVGARRPRGPAIDRAAPPAAAGVGGPGERPAARQGRPAAPRRRLHRGRDGQVARGRAPAHGDAVRASPFKERRSDFNVWAIDTPADESGVSRPSDGVYRRSPIRATYDAFGSERYVLDVRQPSACARSRPRRPTTFVEIVVNDRKYGGGGIFNLYATVAADNAFTPYVFVHEFGHHFAGLADEYYTSDVAYGPAAPARLEPWEPNVDAPSPAPPSGRTSLHAGHAAADALDQGGVRGSAEGDPGAPPEDPRREAARGGDGGAVPRGAAERSTRCSRRDRTPGRSARSRAPRTRRKGYYRPQANCIMFTRTTGFCAACRRAIERVIDLYAVRK